ncbi:MAG: BtpA/SgcQ family protein [Myxococcales bacterium]|nr:BtpA/SgcQ family protein [Myxococcales bacterium]
MSARPLPFDARFIGMIHLDPLPGAPDYAGDIESVAADAAEAARALAEGGVTAIMLENFNDAPFYKDHLPPETVAALTRCALAVRGAAPAVPLGVNALRNDGPAALAVAVAVGARFIRVNVLCGAMVTDQGLIEGCAAELIRMRRALAADVAILADVGVKHAQPLGGFDLAQSAKDTALRGRADALIVSGSGTGAPTPQGRIDAVRAAVPGVPVLVGSGTTVETVDPAGADGFIVGTALKRDGRVDAERVRAMARALGLGGATRAGG